jgi:TPR repeat protein
MNANGRNRFEKRSRWSAMTVVLAGTLVLVGGGAVNAQFVPGEVPVVESPSPAASLYEALATADRSPRGTARTAVPPDQFYQQGMRLSEGKEVRKDPVEAVYWLKLSVLTRLGPAEQYALNQLAYFNASGDGVKKDIGTARLLWELSAASGNGNAMYNLGYLFESGSGVAADPDAARLWYEKAKAAGYEKAQDALSRLKK